jgi:hypothetical protein
MSEALVARIVRAHGEIEPGVPERGNGASDCRISTALVEHEDARQACRRPRAAGARADLAVSSLET